ncbi:MAG: hypothetical protein ACTFAL_08615 [Candidatus Electronema sp. V4]|uniref:hypothetical protein n=1 Tax=Candidatus Electronema sp. V4 TaxID=3454756 RepID=UPI0040556F32
MLDKMKKIILLIFCFLFIDTQSYGWWSENPALEWEGDTHERISKDSLNSVSEDDYPDLIKYYDVIWQATEGKLDDDSAHNGNGAANDGPSNDWWLNALTKYKELKFEGEGEAFWYIGQMIHLIEDMAVPAHAIDIKHPFPAIDNFEHYAAGNYIINNEGVFHPSCIYPVCSPDMYKDKLKTKTITIVNNSWSDFWIERSKINDLKHIEKYCTDGYLGCYGADGDKFNDYYAAKEEKELKDSQLIYARNYAAGALTAASKQLPPIIIDCKFSNIQCSPHNIPIIDSKDKHSITFSILENRKKNIKIFFKP